MGDPAALYGVSTRELVQAVKRNRKRFPKDFMLQPTDDVCRNLEVVFEAIRDLMRPLPASRRRIGFHQ
jgi:hypothetical protein